MQPPHGGVAAPRLGQRERQTNGMQMRDCCIHACIGGVTAHLGSSLRGAAVHLVAHGEDGLQEGLEGGAVAQSGSRSVHEAEQVLDLADIATKVAHEQHAPEALRELGHVHDMHEVPAFTRRPSHHALARRQTFRGLGGPSLWPGNAPFAGSEAVGVGLAAVARVLAGEEQPDVGSLVLRRHRALQNAEGIGGEVVGAHGGEGGADGGDVEVHTRELDADVVRAARLNQVHLLRLLRDLPAHIRSAVDAAARVRSSAEHGMP